MHWAQIVDMMCAIVAEDDEEYPSQINGLSPLRMEVAGRYGRERGAGQSVMLRASEQTSERPWHTTR